MSYLYVILPRFLRAFLPQNRALIRTSLSAAILLSLILFAVLCFSLMIGRVPSDSAKIDNGRYSEGHTVRLVRKVQ